MRMYLSCKRDLIIIEHIDPRAVWNLRGRVVEGKFCFFGFFWKRFRTQSDRRFRPVGKGQPICWSPTVIDLRLARKSSSRAYTDDVMLWLCRLDAGTVGGLFFEPVIRLIHIPITYTCVNSLRIYICNTWTYRYTRAHRFTHLNTHIHMCIRAPAHIL